MQNSIPTGPKTARLITESDLNSPAIHIHNPWPRAHNSRSVSLKVCHKHLCLKRIILILNTDQAYQSSLETISNVCYMVTKNTPSFKVWTHIFIHLYNMYVGIRCTMFSFNRSQTEDKICLITSNAANTSICQRTP